MRASRSHICLRHEGSGQGLCRTLAAYGAATCRAPHLLVSIFACNSVAAVLLTSAANQPTACPPIPCPQLQVQRPGQPRRHRGCGRRQRRRGDQQEQQEGGSLRDRADWNRPLLRCCCWVVTIVSSCCMMWVARMVALRLPVAGVKLCAADGAHLTSAPWQLPPPALRRASWPAACARRTRAAPTTPRPLRRSLRAAPT